MRNLAATALLSASLLLGGCATFGGGGTAPNWDNLVLQVQQAARAVCRFEPAFETVVAIFQLGVPYLSTVSQVTGAICDSVREPSTAARKGVRRQPMVGGVPVHGRYI